MRMRHHSILWTGAALLVVGILLGLRACATGEDASSPARNASIGAAEGGSEILAGGAAADEAARRALLVRRNNAMHEAVSTLHQYLTALGGDDRSGADAFWAGGKPPARSGEADLRSLEGLHALRIQNGRPTAMDAGPVPDALEIPVELRASFDDAPARRYRGWYRLRRAVADGSWEITSASIDVLPRAE
jgi:hypothetical protein